VQTFALGAEEATRVSARRSPSTTPAGATGGRLRGDPRVPAGVVVAITPFNFPLNLVAHKLAPAFAVGAPVVLKPAPQTPLTAALLAPSCAEACDRVGVRRGAMLSVLPCAVDVAESLVTDPASRWCRSPAAPRWGGHLRAKAPKKRVLLELGGNAAVIVCADADVDRALSRVIPGAYGYAGQVCIKVQRLLVHADIAESFTERLASAPRRRRWGPARRGDALCGPLIDARSGAGAAWIDEAVGGGARVVVGGARAGNRSRPRWSRTPAGDEGGGRGGLRPGAHACTWTEFDEADRRGERRALRAPGGDLHPRHRTIARAFRAWRWARWWSTTRRPSAPTRCPTAA
jgi:acyl-CoA reductase-like NAD-dependent aldehyde dehydrogenase